MISVGIDPSTHTGVAVVDSSTGVIFTKEVTAPKGHQGILRAVTISSEVLSILREYNPDMICLEGYSLHSKFNLATMVELGTILRMSLMSLYPEYYEVAPTSLKKFATGKGNAAKQVVIMNIYKRFNFETDNDNVADAVALAYMPLYMASEAQVDKSLLPKVTQGQLSALSKVQRVVSEIYRG